MYDHYVSILFFRLYKSTTTDFWLWYKICLQKYDCNKKKASIEKNIDQSNGILRLCGSLNIELSSSMHE